MTPERIAELRALCEAATTGPWEVERRAELRRWTVRSEPTEETVAEIVHWSDTADRADAALIAAARTALPEALDEIERLQAEVARERAREEVATIVGASNARAATMSQAAYDRIWTALADVEVPPGLDKGHPCLDRIAALKAERDAAQASADYRLRELERIAARNVAAMKRELDAADAAVEAALGGLA